MVRTRVLALILGTTWLGCASKDAAPNKTDVSGVSGRKAEAQKVAKEAEAPGVEGRADGGDKKYAPAPDVSISMGSGAPPSMDAPSMPEKAKDIAPPAAAGVRAGEWDDNANYRDYVKWLGQSPRNVARLDVSDRQFIVVTDKDGKPMPNCKVGIYAGGVKVPLVTMASGRALWFPRAYAGASAAAEVVTECAGARATAKLDGKLDSIARLVLPVARDVQTRRTIDLAFVLDTTGSMSEEIEAVKQTIRTVADKLSNDQTDVRIGLVEYKDRGDSLVTKTYEFSSDLRAFARNVSGIVASGGGDTPEDMQQGVSDALDKLQWRNDAASRMVVVIADAPPHLDYQDERSFADSAKLAAARGIKLFTVSASGMDDTGQVVMRQMAQFTGGANMFVLRGGAGPQSVGGGDPKSSCGGAQEQYASGNLDALIVSKVKRELASLDGDPLRIAGIGKDELSKPCNERLVMAQ